MKRNGQHQQQQRQGNGISANGLCKAFCRLSVSFAVLCLMFYAGSQLLQGATVSAMIQQVKKPDPVLVSKGGDDMSSGLLEYSARAWAEVRNDGGDGKVVFEVTFMQGSESWKKTTTKFMSAHETTRFELVFDEVSLLGGQSKYRVRAYAM